MVGWGQGQEIREVTQPALPLQDVAKPRARIVGARSQPNEAKTAAVAVKTAVPKASIHGVHADSLRNVERVREEDIPPPASPTSISKPPVGIAVESKPLPVTGSLALPDPVTEVTSVRTKRAEQGDFSATPHVQVQMASLASPLSNGPQVTISSRSESVGVPSSVSDIVPDGVNVSDPIAWLEFVRSPMLRYQVRSELSLEEAIHAAIEFAPEIDILRADVGISNAEITKQQAVFDWSQFIQSNWDERNIPVGSTLDGAIGRSENHTLQNSLGLTKRVPFGGQFKLAQDLGLSDSNSQFFIPPNQAKSKIGMEFSQPLLQGGGKLVATSQIKIAIANASVSEEEYMAGLQRHLIDVITAYWELVRSRGEFVVAKRSYERAQQTAAITANRAQLDVGPLQIARTNATVASRLNDVLRAEYAIILAQENLLKLIFGPQFKAAVNAEVIPNSPFLGPLQSVNVDAEVDWSLQNRPEVRRALQLIQRTSIEEGVARNQLLPALALTMSVSNQGLAGNRAMSDSLSDQWNLGDPTYGVGLAYSFPVGNRSARANLRQVELRVRKFCKELEQTVGTVALEVRNASHSLNLAGQTRETTRNALNMADWELQTLENRTRLLVDGDQVGPLYLDNLLQSKIV